MELDVRVARIGSRLLALLLDVGVQLCGAVLLAGFGAVLLSTLDLAGTVDAALTAALRTVGLVLVLVGYPVLCETLNHGRTLGKLAVGLRVVRIDGGPVGFRQALTRALVGVAVEWPGLVLPLLTWVAGVTVMLTDPRGRRLGDLAAGTMVVHDRQPSGPTYFPAVVPPLVGWAGTLDLTRLDDDLALAVRQFLGRSPALTRPARRALARLLWAEVAAVTSPPPPPGLPEWTYLAAVLAERHARAARRLAAARAATATLWPELPAGTRWTVPWALPGPSGSPAAPGDTAAVVTGPGPVRERQTPG